MAPPDQGLRRQTRSGRLFSAWTGTNDGLICAPASFDTAARLREASKRMLAALAEPGADCDDGPLLQPPDNDGLPFADDMPTPDGQDEGGLDSPEVEGAVLGRDGAADLTCSENSALLGRNQGPAAARKRRDKGRSKDRRRQKRAQAAKGAALRGGILKDVATRRASAAPAIQTKFTMGSGGSANAGPLPAHLPLTSAAFVSRNIKPSPAYPSTVTKSEALERGLRYVEWDGRVPQLILDREERVIGALVGMPRDEGWSGMVADVCVKFEAARGTLNAGALREHRRGCFVALSSGISYGGGQTEPSNRAQPSQKQRVAVEGLLAHPGVQRIAGFGSASLRLYAPRLHAYYSNSLESLLRRNSKLRPNFANSVFAGATFNLGPHTATQPHIDHLNLPSGLCAITALGDFDPRCSGHLILWDLGLIIEFPPGATVLIPSALICHSNVAVRSWERRYSLTQYSAGGLFQWVECGFQPQKAFSAAGNQHGLTGEGRWAEGLARLSTLHNIRTSGTQNFS
ncbi:hypothetical protein PYCCODRAFT_1464571 [Trametes coccinea BRFM310]|uniref:Uncharacterized protein n=1 Tax=Trametes coccinea (strain BRFM310) TaxID=1353009 RepID=A0A1Y2IXI2_TRAC3|nr:hypothetical protein PYCCODRAFT_1464571 [Trametes coccinea BRFM310]